MLLMSSLHLEPTGVDRRIFILDVLWHRRHPDTDRREIQIAKASDGLFVGLDDIPKDRTYEIGITVPAWQ
jgi:hypothetical protein